MSAIRQLPYAGAPSGTTQWLPALAEFVLEALSRIQIRGSSITVEHIIEARRSMNFILQEWSNRGVNLWKVGDPDICLPMQPGVSRYEIPRDTVNLLDSYVRIYTPNSTVQSIGFTLIPEVTRIPGTPVTIPTTNLGASLTPIASQSHNPIVGNAIGDPLVLEPGSGVLSCTIGSPLITLEFPAIGLVPGAPLIWGCPISIGGLAISGTSIITAVDGGSIQFNAGSAALETQTNQGGTPLFWTAPVLLLSDSGQPLFADDGVTPLYVPTPVVGCILPGHGLANGQTFTIPIPTVLAGHTLSGTYTVGAVTSSYEFFFSVGTPTAKFLFSENGAPLVSDSGIPLIADWSGIGGFITPDAKFENAGQIPVSSEFTPLVTGQPIVTQPFGDPTVTQPGSQTLSSTKGSPIITLHWPCHELIEGSPIFWGCPVSVGGLSFFGFSIVTRVLNENTIQFLAPEPARETQINQGGTPLFWTSTQSPLVGCVLPDHGLCPGDQFTIPISTPVGGLNLLGTYTVAFVTQSYEFFFNPTGTAVTILTTEDGILLTTDNGIPLIVEGDGSAFNDVQFENSGRLPVATQQSNLQWTDIFLWPISRNDYAFIPNKRAQGRPTTYWYDRTIRPTIQVWPIPPVPQQLALIPPDNQSPSIFGPGPFFGFIGYRMREIEDANPTSGQGLDAPRRFFPVFAAELCAALAEKYKPDAWTAKVQIALILWEKASMEDREKVEFNISPDFSGFFN